MTERKVVWHLIRKDLVQLRWWLSGYVMLTLGATVVAFRSTGAEQPSWSALLSPALWLLAGIIAGLLVQADVPSESRAFWVSHPISASSLLAAKLCTAFSILLLPPLLAQLLALLHFRVDPLVALSMLFTSFWVYAVWLLIAMLLAALTSRFAGYIAALVAVPVGLMLVGIVVNGSPWRLVWPEIPIEAVGLFATVASSALLVTIYRSRRTNRAMLTAGLLVGASGLLVVTRPTARAVQPALIAANVAPIRLAIDVPDLTSLEETSEQFVSFNAAGLQPGYRYAFLQDSAIATYTDGTVVPLRTQVTWGQVPFVFGSDTNSSGAAFSMWLSTARGRQNQPPAQIARIHVPGTVETLVPARISTLPASGSATFVDGDMGIEIRGPQSVRSGASVDLTRVFRDRTDVTGILGMRRYFTARLVWPDRQDTVGIDFNFASDQQRVLVLPGASVHVVSLRQEFARTRTTDSLPGPLNQASLELVQWKTASRYPVAAAFVAR